jgi:hypothetical protein
MWVLHVFDVNGYILDTYLFARGIDVVQSISMTERDLPADAASRIVERASTITAYDRDDGAVRYEAVFTPVIEDEPVFLRDPSDDTPESDS